MSDAIFMLRLEHRNIARVLSVIEDQLDRADDGAPVDQALLLLAMDYLAGFPDACHHPKEDLIDRKLRQRHPGSVAAGYDLEGSHERLGQRTAELRERARESAERPGGLAEGLSRELRSFVEDYRQHMTLEEEHLFSAALSTLSPDELAEIDFRIFDQIDHLFDANAEARFARLQDAIDRRARETGASAVSRAATQGLGHLAELNGVDAFNRVLGDRGIRLVRYTAGGYALECDGRWLLDIPDCPPPQAAWAAAFYLEGRATRDG